MTGFHSASGTMVMLSSYRTQGRTKMDDEEREVAERYYLDKLKDPFPIEKVKYRQGPGGKQLAYIDARDVADRLD